MQLSLNGVTLVSNLIVAERTIDRMVGLLGRKELPSGSAMLLRPCGSIHTFGMQFAIDLIFVDAQMYVVRTVGRVPPNRMAFGGWHAKSVIELQTGWFDLSRINKGDQLSIITHLQQ